MNTNCKIGLKNNNKKTKKKIKNIIKIKVMEKEIIKVTASFIAPEGYTVGDIKRMLSLKGAKDIKVNKVK